MFLPSAGSPSAGGNGQLAIHPFSPSTERNSCWSIQNYLLSLPSDTTSDTSPGAEQQHAAGGAVRCR